MAATIGGIVATASEEASTATPAHPFAMSQLLLSVPRSSKAKQSAWLWAQVYENLVHLAAARVRAASSGLLTLAAYSRCMGLIGFKCPKESDTSANSCLTHAAES